MKILAIETDLSAESVLRQAGHYVVTSANWEEARELLKQNPFDFIVLDLNLLSRFEYETSPELQNGPPILILTNIKNVEVIVWALDNGADDYVTKPFHNEELMARIHAVARRSQYGAEEVIQIGDVSIDLKKRAVSILGERIYLAPKEYKIVELLSRNEGETLTKRQVLSHLYDDPDKVDVRSLTQTIRRIRDTFSKSLPGGGRYLETIHGIGYRMGVPQKFKTKRKYRKRG